MSEKKLTPEQVKEKNKELQGKRQINKKKTNNFTKTEAQAELKRLERAGHQQSVYYQHVLSAT